MRGSIGEFECLGILKKYFRRLFMKICQQQHVFTQFLIFHD